MNQLFRIFLVSAAALCFSVPLCGQSLELPQNTAPPTTSVCAEQPRADALPSLCVPANPDEGSSSESATTTSLAVDAGSAVVQIPLQLPEGTPLRIAIDQRARIGRIGEPVLGHVVEAVYAFDAPVIPAGTVAVGRVSQIDSVPKFRRARAYIGGNFSPFHQYQVQFDSLRLPNGQQITIHTTVSQGTAEVIHLVSKGGQEQNQDHKGATSQATDKAKQAVKGQVEEAKDTLHRAEDEIRQPGRLHRLKQFVVGQSPYRRQYVTEGTRFTALLKDPLDFGSESRTREQLAKVGGAAPSQVLLHARLILEVSSATATRGNPVVAELTQPVFSEDHRLLLPADTRLIGRVLEAKPARSLHRNGELRVIFEHLEVPNGAIQPVQGSLEGIEVNRAAHMKLDEEGGAHATDSKTRYLSTGVAILLTAAAARTDVERGEVDQAGDPAVRAGAGASGFGLAGTLIGLVAKSQPVSIAFSAYGATTSIYSNFLSRGHEVILPKDAPLEIGLGLSRRPAASHP